MGGIKNEDAPPAEQNVIQQQQLEGGTGHDKENQEEREDRPSPLPPSPQTVEIGNVYPAPFSPLEGSPLPVPELTEPENIIGSPQWVVEEEGIGESWKETPWKRPSVDEARERRRQNIFDQGQASLWKTSPEELALMGPGIKLYFQLLRAMSFFFLAATLLHLPHLYFAYSANMLAKYKVSPTTVGSFMAANHMIGYPGSNTTTWCNTDAGNTLFEKSVSCTLPVIGLGSGQYIKSTHASYVITSCDIVTCLLFLLTWYYLAKKLRSISIDGLLMIKTNDYAIKVKGLPVDATETEIVQHFSRLYAINGGEDWTYRGACCELVEIKRTKRVPESIVDVEGNVIGPDLSSVQEPLTFHEHKLYRFSWVIETTVAHPIGNLISRFRKLEKLSDRLLWQRAYCKKYDEKTTFKRGPNKELFEKGKAKLAKIEERIHTEKLKLRSLAPALLIAENTCVGAFVIFEHRRSRDRALRDYRRWSNYLVFRRPPPPLLFRGKHRLYVSEAPQPSDIIYESLEVKFIYRLLRRLITNIMTAILLFATLLMLLKLRTKTANFEEAGRTDMCDVISTRIYGVPSTSSYYHYGPGNAYCSSSNDHYLSLLPPSSQTSYSNNCTNPCFDVKDPAPLDEIEVCSSGITLQRASIIKCFCLTQLGTELASKGPLQAYHSIRHTYYDLCKIPALDYLSGQILSLTTSCVTVAVNEAIRFLLSILVEFELHTSLSESTIFFFGKSLIFLIANTAGLLFLVNAHYRNKALNNIGLFAGSSMDFDLSWYMQVGIALTNTMLLNTVATQLPFLILELCILPLWRLYRSAIRVSQLHLNKVFAPSLFRLHTRLATVINTLIITFFFSPALPLLIPFALIFFATSYVVDILMLFRCCAKPPAYDARLVATAIHMMPYVLICHICFAIWIFSNGDFFASGIWDSSSIGKTSFDVYQTLESSTAAFDVVGFVPRLIRYNTLPLTMLLALLIVAKVIALIGLDVIGSLGKSIIKPFKKCLRSGGAVQVQDEETRSPKVKGIAVEVNIYPPYSRRFEVAYMNRKKVPSFTPESGWTIEQSSPNKECVKLVKKWTATGSIDGIKHEKGAYKKTWEVLKDSGLHTYRIEDNPLYAEAMLVKSTLHLSAKSLLRLHTRMEDEIAEGDADEESNLQVSRSKSKKGGMSSTKVVPMG